MTFEELTTAVDRVMRRDEENPGTLKPLVAIGHTKDLEDFETIQAFLAWLREKKIKVSTLQEIHHKCRRAAQLGEHAEASI